MQNKTWILLILFITATSLTSCQPSKSELLNFASDLKELGFCNEEKYRGLILEINKNSVRNGFEMLPFLKNSLTLDYNHYTPLNQKSIEKLHDDISIILPNLGFTEFKVRTIIDSSQSDNESQSIDYEVQLKSNGKIYKNRFYAYSYYLKENKISPIDWFDSNLLNIFNKILADLNSEFRLREVTDLTKSKAESQKFGILCVTKEQSKYIHQYSYNIMSLEYDTFSTIGTEKSILNYLKIYQEARLLSHLSKNQISNSIDKILSGDIQEKNDILLAFPKTILFFDTELDNLENPYQDLLTKYGEYSHGDFNPTEISDNFKLIQNGIATLKFTLKGRKYSKKFKIDRDWIDPEFFDYVDSIIASNRCKGKFYWLKTESQEASLIYLSKNQYQFLKSNKALDFDDSEIIEGDSE